MRTCTVRILAVALCALLLFTTAASAQRTVKPVLHGSHWVAITGKPLGATAGAMIFNQGGNAVDAACAMLAATSTMWDTLGWGGETQALIYDPRQKKVVGINALGVAPTGATVEFFEQQGLDFPPEFGPQAGVTPGTPGGLLVMLRDYGTMSLEQVLAPAIEMADGYPMEEQAANSIERAKESIKEWPYSRDIYLPHLGEEREAPYGGEIFRQPDLATTLRKMVDAEQKALIGGATREAAIQSAYDRFYRGDIAEEFVRGSQEMGGLHTMEDLANWEVYIEEPVKTSYKGIDVYKLTTWVQGPVMLQALNILENLDLQSMGYNSSRYMHAIYQAMNLAYADRDFYYGDPYFPPEEPIAGLLSKDYAKQRAALIGWESNDADARPGDPYAFQDGENPFLEYLNNWHTVKVENTAGGDAAGSSFGAPGDRIQSAADDADFYEDFYAGTTSIQAADAEGWVVSITPSGGWIPAAVAGRTGVGMSQRMQSFVLDPADNPYNVVQPGQRPRATLTPGMAIKDGQPFLSFAVQGGDGQDQNLLQFFLNTVEWNMNVQQAAEAPNINSFQMRGSFGEHESRPGRMLIQEATPPWVRAELRRMGYELIDAERTSGPINAIFFDWEHGSLWGGSSHHGEDYGIAW